MSQHATDARLFAKEISKILDTSLAEKRLTPKVSTLFSKLVKHSSGAKTAVVESAVPLTQSEKRMVEKHFAATAEYRIHPELLTGIKIHVGELLIDMSGQTVLGQFVDHLIA